MSSRTPPIAGGDARPRSRSQTIASTITSIAEKLGILGKD
jgi:hypothetical protein